MTSVEIVLHRITADLSQVGCAFALVGGLAVSARTEPRFTRDVDLAIAVTSDLEAEALVHRLRGAGYRIGATLEQEDVGRLATVSLEASRAPHATVVDLLFASSGIEPEIVTEAEALDFLPDLKVKVATTGHLIALKVLSRNDMTRPRDLADLRALLRAASGHDLERARRAISLIVARGYHRDRDLETEFNDLLRA